MVKAYLKAVHNLSSTQTMATTSIQTKPPSGPTSGLTGSDIERALPAGVRVQDSQKLADLVNQVSLDPEVAREVRDNFISYTGVLADGRFKIEDYINAVTYVSFKLMNYNNKESYARTFPQRYADLVARGMSDKDISSYVSAYSKNKLVNLILEQSMIPTWVLNQDIHQQAVNRLAYLMLNANSEKVQSDSANALLTHLKKPEVKQVELNIGARESEGMKELKDTLSQLAAQQIGLIEQGMTTRSVAHQRLVHSDSATDDLVEEAEYEDVTPTPTPTPVSAPEDGQAEAPEPDASASEAAGGAEDGRTQGAKLDPGFSIFDLHKQLTEFSRYVKAGIA